MHAYRKKKEIFSAIILLKQCLCVIIITIITAFQCRYQHILCCLDEQNKNEADFHIKHQMSVFFPIQKYMAYTLFISSFFVSHHFYHILLEKIHEQQQQTFHIILLIIRYPYYYIIQTWERETLTKHIYLVVRKKNFTPDSISHTIVRQDMITEMTSRQHKNNTYPTLVPFPKYSRTTSDDDIGILTHTHTKT